MAIMTEQQARELLTKVLSFSKAEEAQANLSGSNEGNIPIPSFLNKLAEFLMDIPKLAHDPKRIRNASGSLL